jgi:hypothetical protein
MKSAWMLAALGAWVGLPVARSAGDTGPDVTGDVPARVENWRTRIFNRENFLSMRLSGAEAEPVGKDRIDLKDMNITVFAGDGSTRIDTIILSPDASYFPRETRASGPDDVRVIRYRDGVEVCEITGEDWTYEQAGKKVSIRRHVHVVYRQPLNGFAP